MQTGAHHPLFQAVFTRLTDEMSITRIGLQERQLPTPVAWLVVWFFSRCVAAELIAWKAIIDPPFFRRLVIYVVQVTTFLEKNDLLLEPVLMLLQCLTDKVLHQEPSPKSEAKAVLGRQSAYATPWLTERHGYDPTYPSFFTKACDLRCASHHLS